MKLPQGLESTAIDLEAINHGPGEAVKLSVHISNQWIYGALMVMNGRSLAGIHLTETELDTLSQQAAEIARLIREAKQDRAAAGKLIP